MPPKKSNKKPAKQKVKTHMVSAPAAKSRVVTTAKPKLANKKDSIVISHRELFGTVRTSGLPGDFQVDAYSINPGNSLLFPWLSTQAFAWERYRFHKLSIRYVPRCPTTTAGTLILSPDYDAADESPVGEAQACSYADAVSSVPWAEVMLHMRKEPLLGGSSSKYVRSGALKENLDIKTYDCGTLNVCMDTAETDAVWGKLWVDYVVELITPHTIPIPLTSTFAGTYPNTAGYVGIPDTYPFIKNNTPASVNEKAGPINIDVAMRSPYMNGAANASAAVDIKGLVTGATYLIQTLIESGASSTYTATTTPVVEGLKLIANTLTYPYNYTSGAANRKTVMTEGIYRALSSIATLVPQFDWLPGTLGATNAVGTQVVVSPIVSDPAWTLL